jgi:hypothetical protein
MKRILCTIIMCILIISLTGCNTKPVLSQSHKLRLVKKTEKAKYLITNALQINQTPDIINPGSGDVSIDLPAISGLKDKELETKINNNIKIDVKNEMKDYEAEKGERIDYAICIVDLNINNLLSINIYCNDRNPIGGILYNLTNGKRLYLSDIFTKGTDYIALTNEEVTLGIIGGNTPEENILREPFTTIKSNQTYALTESTLYIIFHAGESGFEDRTAIGIPLSKIDDYVDIMDRDTGKQFIEDGVIYNYPSLIVKKNNIFTTPKGEVFKRNNGRIAVFYPIVSGIQDTNFQNTINTTIMKKIKEVVNSRDWDYIKSTDPLDNQIGTVFINAIFNAYGILTLSQAAYNKIDYVDLQEFNTTYSFDLCSSKPIEINDIINSYKAKDKVFEKAFVNHVKDSIKAQNSYLGKASINKIFAVLDYPYIMKNASINFGVFAYPTSLQISIQLLKSAIDGIPNNIYCSFPLEEIINGTPEEFLKYR